METTNLSKIKREKMLNTINEIKKDINDEKILENISLIENELNKKKYGLIWEEHEERVDVELETQIPTFEETISKKIKKDNNKEFNFLLEGDNMHSLYLLEKTHGEKIDIIYIDPPYNTGNDEFKYNDKYIDKEDNYRHSKWISFMKSRLLKAQTLLKKDGLIFISIDDNELYQLKLLCDDIFGEDNFIANLVIETANGVFGTRASQINKTFVKVKDYVLVYAKNKRNINRDFIPLYMPTNDVYDSHYSVVLDEDLNKTSVIEYLKSTNEVVNIFKKYNMNVTIDNISKLMNLDKKFNEFIISHAENIYQEVAFSLKIDEETENKLSAGNIIRYKNYILFKTKNGQGQIRQYIPFKNSLKNTDEYISQYKKAVAIGDLWEGFDCDMKNVTKEANIEFSNGKKPIRLIKQLIKWANVNNGYILDFFAGSGTTGHAVLELNKEDDGNRKFILCTNNENNICEEITYRRLENVINGYNKVEGIPSNLKYYKTSYVPRMNNEEVNLHSNLLVNIKNLIQLENGIEIDDKIIQVFLEEEKLDCFSEDKEQLDICDKIYISSDTLITSKQEEIFKDNNIEVFIIPEYYFEEEIMEVM